MKCGTLAMYPLACASARSDMNRRAETVEYTLNTTQKTRSDMGSGLRPGPGFPGGSGMARQEVEDQPLSLGLLVDLGTVVRRPVLFVGRPLGRSAG